MAVFLCVGIVFSYLRIFHGVSLWWLFLLTGLSIPFAFCGKRGLLKTALAVLLLIASFFVGFYCFYVQMRKQENVTVYNNVHRVQGTVEDKIEGRYYACLILKDITVAKNEEEFKLIAYMPSAFCENVELYDKVFLYGKVTTDPKEYTAGNFSAHAIREGIRYRMEEVESCVVVGKKFDFFGSIRIRIAEVLYRGMDKETASVTMAVLTGNTAGIEDGLLENMRYGGIAHIFAVSGLHVGALFAFCIFLTSKTPLRKMPKIARFFLVAFLLIFYGGICGFSASVIRATVLCLVGYAAKLLGVSVDRFEALGLGGIIVLLISPVELFSPGFQLSFLACLGIFLWYKPLEKWGNHVCVEFVNYVHARRALKQFSKSIGKQTESITAGKTIQEASEEKSLVTLSEKARRGVISFLSVSISTQLATAPVCLHTFGYLSGWSLLLNIFFVPFISGAFSTLLIFVIIACILPTSAAPIVLYVPNVVWSAVLLLFEGCDFSTFALDGITLNVGAFICYYGGLSFFSDKWNVSVKFRKCFFVLFALAFVIITFVLNI